MRYLSVKETQFASTLAAVVPLPQETSGYTDPAFQLEMGRRISLGVLVIGALFALRMFRGPKKASDSAAVGATPQLAAEGAGFDHMLSGGGANPEFQR